MTEREAGLLVNIGAGAAQAAIDAHKPGALKAIEANTRRGGGMTDEYLEENGWLKVSNPLGEPYWNHAIWGDDFTRAGAVFMQRKDDARLTVAIDGPPAPRPTCGTCPHWKPLKPTIPNPRVGRCTFYPPTVFEKTARRQQEDYCGQHPEMPAWIRDEWPKVRAGR